MGGDQDFYANVRHSTQPSHRSVQKELCTLGMRHHSYSNTSSIPSIIKKHWSLFLKEHIICIHRNNDFKTLKSSLTDLITTISATKKKQFLILSCEIIKCKAANRSVAVHQLLHTPFPFRTWSFFSSQKTIGYQPLQLIV